MKKPDGVGEWDGYPMPNIPSDREPISKEEEERLCAEARENIRKILKETPVRKDPEREKANKQRKIG